MDILLKEGIEIKAPNDNFPLRKFKLIKNIHNNIYISKASGWNELEEVTLQFIESYRVDQRFLDNLEFVKYNQEKSETKEIFSQNFVKILESDWINQQQYFLIVMEKIETDLFQYLKESREQLQSSEKLQIHLDIAQSIALIYNHDFLSRYIKLESFFKVQNRFKLDYMMMTQNIGTNEMIQNKPKLTLQVDVRSLAYTFDEILYGKPLFDQNPEIEIKNNIQNQKPIQEKNDNLLIPREFKQKNIQNPEEKQYLNIQQIILGLEQIINNLKICQINNNSQFQINKSQNPKPNTLSLKPQKTEKQIIEITQNDQEQKLQTSQIKDQKIESLEQKVIELSETTKQLNENQENARKKVKL